MSPETYRNLLFKMLFSAIVLLIVFAGIHFIQQTPNNASNKPPQTTGDEPFHAAGEQVFAGDEIQTTAETRWIIWDCYGDGYEENISALTAEMNSEENINRQYIGLSREELLLEIARYMEEPSPEDRARGLQEIEIESFSAEKIVLRKIFTKEKASFYYLVFMNDFLVVYENDMNNIFMNTGIQYNELQEIHRNEIGNCKIIYGQGELFRYLEALTS